MHTEETKRKMKESALKSWGSGRVGWNKGLTKETSSKVRANAQNISKALMGHTLSKETIEKIRKKAIGRELTTEHRRKISEGVKANPKVMKTRFKKGHIQTDEINSRKASKGEKNHAWIDGRSYDKHYLPAFRKIRKTIILRDNEKCVLCPSTNNLAVHHIDYEKTNNSPENLITLCHSHHSQTNHNRELWMEKFK